jgi:PKD repeat protein
LVYSSIIQSPAALWHRVVPYDAEGNPGEPSNAVLRPSNEPIIYEVIPTEGYQHEEYTFTATVTGAEPLAYAWGFGGGATPNTSSAISPTVSLADAGEYAATLTVINAYGSAEYPFTLTVNERDMWAHTWGGFRSDTAVNLMLDAPGNAYIVGETDSFGAGYTDLLLLKYAADGELLWARTWGTTASENVAGAMLMEDMLRVVGDTYISGVRRDDVVFLEYDLEGNLLSSRTFGGDDYDRVNDIYVDPEGDIYVAGELNVYAGNADVLVAKFASDLSCLWARACGGAGDDRARGLAVTADGSVFVACNVDKLTEENDIGLLKYSSGGELEWAVAWDSGADESTTGIVLDGQGNLCLLGGTNGFGAGDRDILLTRWDTDGQLIAARTWGAPDRESHARMFLDPVGGVRISGATSSFGPSSALMLKLDANFDLLVASKWNVEYTDYEVMMCDHNGDLYTAGYTSSLGGQWEEVEISEEQVGGTVRSLWTDDRELDWSEGTLEGEDHVPEGEEDTSAGSVDVLVAKNMPW